MCPGNHSSPRPDDPRRRIVGFVEKCGHATHRTRPKYRGCAGGANFVVSGSNRSTRMALALALFSEFTQQLRD
jgi:hypothetical protein